MTTKKTSTKINQLIDDYGLDLNEPLEKIPATMKEGLARMYADAGFKAYLENTIKIANRNMITAYDKGLEDEAKRFANRIEVLLQLLVKAKDCFINTEKFRNLENKITEIKL